LFVSWLSSDESFRIAQISLFRFSTNIQGSSVAGFVSLGISNPTISVAWWRSLLDLVWLKPNVVISSLVYCLVIKLSIFRFLSSNALLRSTKILLSSIFIELPETILASLPLGEANLCSLVILSFYSSYSFSFCFSLAS
jgi:hypothetical protein